MRKVIFIALAIIGFLFVMSTSTVQQIERPLYTGELSFSADLRYLTGKLNYTLPSGNYEQIVFNFYAHAFDEGLLGNFVFSEHQNRVFAHGDARGSAQISAVVVNGQPAEFSLIGTRLTIQPSKPLPQNRPIQVDMDLEMAIPQLNFRNGYNAKATWIGNWLPLLAPRDGDSWLVYPYYAAGDPFFNEVADFFVEIVVPKDCLLVAPGSVHRTSGDTTATYAIKAETIREFALAISPHYTEYTHASPLGFETSLYTYSVAEDMAQRLLTELDEMLEFFSIEVGPYPYPALRLVQTGWFLGGMEYPQVIFLGDATLQAYNTARSTMLHELAHQWFYSAIGNNQVTDSWIDEGLATFFQTRYLQGENLHAYYAQERESLAVQLARLADIRLGQPLSIYPTWEAYYRVNYRRSALMQYDLYMLIGAEKYRAFARSLFDTYKHSELDKDDFIKLASDVYGEDLNEWFVPWFRD